MKSKWRLPEREKWKIREKETFTSVTNLFLRNRLFLTDYLLSETDYLLTVIEMNIDLLKLNGYMAVHTLQTLVVGSTSELQNILLCV